MKTKINKTRLFIPLLLTMTSLNVIAEQQSQITTEKAVKEQKAEKTAPQLSENDIADLLDNMVWVEGGSFQMGSDHPDARNREKPVHKVSLDGFYIQKTEMTQDIFQKIMGWNTSYYACEKCPVNNVSWKLTQAFIEKLNKATGKTFRLPTEAEWEYAAKGGKHQEGFLFSGSNNIDDVAWYADNSQRKSQPVAQKKPNALGLYDMTGNMWEMCQDDMSRNAYKSHEAHNPFYTINAKVSKTALKVIRGGGYEFSPKESYIFIRDGATSNVRMPDIGFRLAMNKDK